MAEELLDVAELMARTEGRDEPPLNLYRWFWEDCKRMALGLATVEEYEDWKADLDGAPAARGLLARGLLALRPRGEA